MLVKPYFVGLDRRMSAILSMIAGNINTQPEELRTGVYEIGHFSFESMLMRTDFDQKYPKVVDYENEHYIGSYGVCDEYQQVLDKCPEIQTLPDRFFVMSVTEIARVDQHPEGGWRWHKWGEYIGKHEPKCEYLYDEEGIDRVYVYSLIELKNGQFEPMAAT